MTRPDFNGTLPALITPFKENGEIDFDRLKVFVEWLLPMRYCRDFTVRPGWAEATVAVEEGLAILKAFADVIVLPEPAAREDIIRHIADAILHKIGVIGAEELRHQTRLKLVARHGVGLDLLDLGCLRSLDIPVSTTTMANSNAVAEATLGLMLACVRKFSQGEAMLKRDRWYASDASRYVTGTVTPVDGGFHAFSGV